MNQKLIKLLRLIATGLMIPLVLTLVINIIEPLIEFPCEAFNRFWGFLLFIFNFLLYLSIDF